MAPAPDSTSTIKGRPAYAVPASRLDQSRSPAPLQDGPGTHVEVNSGRDPDDLTQFLVNDVRGDHAGDARATEREHPRESVSDQLAGQVGGVQAPARVDETPQACRISESLVPQFTNRRSLS